MAEPVVLRSEHEGILELVLNRPDKLNAINEEVLDGIRAAVEDLRLRDELRVLLIRGNGRYFSAGVDLSSFADQDSSKSAHQARSWFRRGMGGMQTLWQEMELVEKPIVVAHHARCVGAALEMSLSCDFRLAARGASYWFPEMKMAMVPASGGISRLTRLCGLHWAKWMILANESVDADHALTMGLVHKVYSDETFQDEVQAFCRQLATFPPEVTAVAKLALEMAADMDSASARQLERLVYSQLTSLEEHKEIKRRHQDKILKR